MKMIFDGVDTSKQSSSNVLGQVSSTKTKKASIDDQREEVEDYSSLSSKSLLGRKESIRLKIQAKGPICKSRRKKIGSLGLFSDDDDEEEERFSDVFDDDDTPSSWLSSNGGSSISSPSYCCCFDDQIFRNLLKFSLDDCLVSLLISSSTNLFSPRFSKTTIFFDGSTVNPLEDATSVLQKSSSYQKEIFHENGLSEEEEIITWLMKSVEVEDEIRLSKWDTQKMGFLGSLIDLDGENSEWISDSNTDFFNIPPIDFPSPSYKNNWSFESQPLIITTDSQQKENKSISSTAKYAAEEEEESEKYEQNKLTDFGGDDREPLFWPCDTKFDWGSEFPCDFLIMSPRKNIRKPGNSEGKLRERIKLALRRGKMDFGRREEHKCLLQKLNLDNDNR